MSETLSFQPSNKQIRLANKPCIHSEAISRLSKYTEIFFKKQLNAELFEITVKVFFIDSDCVNNFVKVCQYVFTALC